ncbi:putative dehydrogenase [Lunatimonas lonarensis]|uniref:Putative dehydrogenase n=1 Tax=Lunatimonas lonarensis TaxID=1232681 RepID=R7ZL63_9BACT|nr:zinc-binding dehydrogenase [Lunatimonas lonarensis]EON74812.1 putative dehydrogenase [Lunatimonas lonarensis]
MRQFTLVKYGRASEAFELNEVQSPIPEPSQLLIQVEGFGLNFADVMARQGLYREAPPLPFVPGYEVVGVVIGQGKQVSGLWVGKRVVAFTRFGGYADTALADYRAAAPIDPQVSGAVACALATQYCTAYYMTDYAYTLRGGGIALIHAAAGGVGTALVQLCKRKGLFTIGLCGSDAKREYLVALGVDLPIRYKEEDYAAIIEKKFGHRSVDYIFNTTMGPSFSVDRRLLSPGGKLFCFGGASRSGSRPSLVRDLSFFLRTGFISPLFTMMQSQAIIGVNMLRLADEKIEIIGACLRELVALNRTGEIEPSVGGEFSFSELSDAHGLLESGKSTGKLYVSW